MTAVFHHTQIFI